MCLCRWAAGTNTHVVAASHVGRTFAQVAAAAGCQELDCFMDLVAKHGDAVRWRVVVANHRPSQVKRIRQPLHHARLQ